MNFRFGSDKAPAAPETGATQGKSGEITVARRGAVAVVTISQPAKRNALSLAMWRSLGEHFRRFAHDDALRAVVLTGAAGHFSAGADISEFGTLRSEPERGETYERITEACEAAIGELPKPVIAAIDGVCMGGGLGVALACDFRLAASDASFAIPAARLGIIYGVRETHLLYAAVGLANAKRILFSGARLDADEAARIGLVDQVAAAPLEAALALATSLAENAPLSIGGAKEILAALAFGKPDQEQIAALMKEAIESDDYREGVAAFREKRRPRFQGQ